MKFMSYREKYDYAPGTILISKKGNFSLVVEGGKLFSLGWVDSISSQAGYLARNRQIFKVLNNKKYAFVEASGKILVPYYDHISWITELKNYDEMGNLIEIGEVSIVRNGDKCGLYSCDRGEEIVPPRYSFVEILPKSQIRLIDEKGRTEVYQWTKDFCIK